MNKARVVIVDDSTFSVMLLTDLLVERGFDVVGAAASTKFGEIVIHVGFSKLGFSKGNDKWTQSM